MVEDLTITKFGLTGSAAAIGARGWALEDAILLTGLAGAIYPAASDVYLAKLSDEIIKHTTRFAINARRDLEIRDIRGVQIKGGRYSIPASSEIPETIKDLRHAIDRILHARELIVYVLKKGNTVFEKLGDAKVVGIEVKSEKFDRCLVDVYGICYTYADLSE